MRRIHDFYRSPPTVGQTIVLRPVYDRGEEQEDWAWFAIDDGEPVPADADPDLTQQYDGRHAREVLYYAGRLPDGRVRRTRADLESLESVQYGGKEH